MIRADADGGGLAPVRTKCGERSAGAIGEMDHFCADEAARIYTALRNSGRQITMQDAVIAGIVKINGGTLLTRDWNHFQRVEGFALNHGLKMMDDG